MKLRRIFASIGATTASLVGFGVGLAIARRLSELREEIDQLLRAKEMLDDAQRIAKIGSWEIDPKTNKLTWSDYYYELLEIEPPFEGTWPDLMYLFDEETKQRIIENFEITMRTKEPQDIDYALTTRSGLRKILHTRGKVDLDEKGNITRLLGTSQDVTETRMIEEELRSARKAAEEANQAKSNFLANMSHEIRTPLSIILGFSELLVDPNETPERRAEFVKTIQKNGELLSDLISGILDLSKVESGKLEPKKEEVDLRQFMEDIEFLMKPKAKEAGLELGFKCVGLVPMTIDTDPRHLKQAFVNVIGNAIKFTLRGRVDIRTSLMTAVNGQKKLVFDIVDTGIGMTKDQSSRLFKRFAQADETMTRKFGGTGLGLILSQKFLQALGGDLRIRYSLPGCGTCFRLMVDPGPLEKRSFTRDLMTPCHEKAAAGTTPVADLLGRRVLVVDDSVDNQLLAERFLRAAGAEVTKAKNGKEGIDMALGGDFDFVLMDIQMPVLDGLSATAILRERGYMRPIIALTAHALSEEREKCLHSGFDGYLTKPISKATLIGQLSRHLSHH